MKIPKKYHNYDPAPTIPVPGFSDDCFVGEAEIAAALQKRLSGRGRTVLTVDCYPGVRYTDVLQLFSALEPASCFCSDDCALSKAAYAEEIADFLTEDPVFGVMCPWTIDRFFDSDRLSAMRKKIAEADGVILVYGVGASLLCRGDIRVYADLSRWEIQLRYRGGSPNWNSDNAAARPTEKFKQGYFIEWRFADRHKQDIWQDTEYFLDTHRADCPKLVTASALFAGLEAAASRPFRLVPYFDPGVWGGHWMQEVFDLDPAAPNYAWSFDGVPEENSLLLDYGRGQVQVPAINLVFYRPTELLGDRVYGRYGAEFPIRFDLLDTMGGQNLSLQVHPPTTYIQQNFGMHYTQDESYYLLDVDEEAEPCVFLGLKKGIDRAEMLRDLARAERGEMEFPADRYVNRIPAKKHDHFLIPAGTVHCSGAGCMVLEISATPYIFTFKLWDWARLDLNGRPRPIHLSHGAKAIRWERDTDFVHRELVGQAETLEASADRTVRKTGLHALEPIVTLTHRSAGRVQHDTCGSVNMLNLVEGAEAVVESPEGRFAPFVVHYAETFVIPACVGRYTIRPHGPAEGGEIMTVKAYIR